MCVYARANDANDVRNQLPIKSGINCGRNSKSAFSFTCVAIDHRAKGTVAIRAVMFICCLNSFFFGQFRISGLILICLDVLEYFSAVPAGLGGAIGSGPQIGLAWGPASNAF